MVISEAKPSNAQIVVMWRIKFPYENVWDFDIYNGKYMILYANWNEMVIYEISM